ncbi:MAG: hypothetical protein ISF22_11300 [Methanomassiliicoccus sp.]|nr:hypothetical protein [Methanomassiliicoccus sp.]
MDLSGTLEGGVRLDHVRRTKRNLMIVQVFIVLAAVFVLTYLGGEIQLKPFYFNVSAVLYFVVLMALVIGVESFFFTYLEQWHTKSLSARSYMLKRSIRRSVVVIVISAVVLVMVLTPYITEAIANSTSESGSTFDQATFINRDSLGLTTVDRIHLVSGGSAEIFVVSEASYLAYAGDIEGLRQHAVATVDDTSPGVDLQFPHTPFGTYYIVVESEQPVEVSYTVHRTVSPTFLAFVSMFAALFIGFYVIWALTATKIRSKYTKGATYK